MTLNKEELSALLRLIDASQTNYTIVSNKAEYQKLTRKLQDQMHKLTA